MLKFLIVSVLLFSLGSGSSIPPTHFGTLFFLISLKINHFSGNTTYLAKRVLTTGCPSGSDFKYPNGSCLSTCPDPYTIETDSGSAFCNPPCGDKYFDSSKNTCLDSCASYFIRIEDGIRYCDASTLCPWLDPFINPVPPHAHHFAPTHFASSRMNVYLLVQTNITTYYLRAVLTLVKPNISELRKVLHIVIQEPAAQPDVPRSLSTNIRMVHAYQAVLSHITGIILKKVISIVSLLVSKANILIL